MQDYRKLEAWQKSHAMAVRTYARTATFPKTELFGLTSQMRRSAISIPANIAEGCYRGGRALAHSLRIAMGSAGESEYYIILASDLKFFTEDDRKTLLAEISNVKAVIAGFLKAVEASVPKAPARKR
jgi:four helix bundle protein